MRRYSFDLASVELSPESLASYDLVLLATDHDRFDYDTIEKHAKLIVDTRGRYLGKRTNVVKA
jgi:UDP-N-acetyl-D-glucosamine dehydrogenase